ncbi:hypothetical protein MOO45_04795 [Bombilactobacillus folatiphilus]|uniref:Uncharacterized protein n=1 Tax=Bombilactobacillus folatiphilus TaxID=2923362 RepID=A0ABY4P7N5_9LACO|nr:hypothetical protein [Bombilactobacillus folatiphilus]UQS81546.1 hypothetical protein MOO45_04795 [Bombilactobacillus folatiphilus]
MFNTHKHHKIDLQQQDFAKLLSRTALDDDQMLATQRRFDHLVKKYQDGKKNSSKDHVNE